MGTRGQGTWGLGDVGTRLLIVAALYLVLSSSFVQCGNRGVVNIIIWNSLLLVFIKRRLSLYYYEVT